jgi:hypothetical protein
MRRNDVAKPPKSTPHSDIDGVHQDEKPNVETAQETGETTANLALAREQASGKPPHSDDDGKEGSKSGGSDEAASRAAS